MKWIVYLFALYMLILPCIPCSGGDLCCAGEVSNTSSKNKAEEQSDRSPVCPCCPFYNCNACHSMAFQSFSIIIQYQTMLVLKPRSNYMAPLGDAYYSSFWKPPRLS